MVCSGSRPHTHTLSLWRRRCLHPFARGFCRARLHQAQASGVQVAGPAIWGIRACKARQIAAIRLARRANWRTCPRFGTGKRCSETIALPRLEIDCGNKPNITRSWSNLPGPRHDAQSRRDSQLLLFSSLHESHCQRLSTRAIKGEPWFDGLCPSRRDKQCR